MYDLSRASKSAAIIINTIFVSKIQDFSVICASMAIVMTNWIAEVQKPNFSELFWISVNFAAKSWDAVWWCTVNVNSNEIPIRKLVCRKSSKRNYCSLHYSLLGFGARTLVPIPNPRIFKLNSPSPKSILSSTTNFYWFFDDFWPQNQ